MLTSRRFLTLGLILGLIFVASANAIVIHNDGNQADYIAYGNQFGSTVWLGAWSGDSYFLRGSAVVIDPHWVLLAAHELFDSARQPRFDGAYIGTGSHVGVDSGDLFFADQWFVHPGFTQAAYSPDLALLYFEDPILGVDYAQRYRGILTQGMPVSIVGFGDTGTPAGGVVPSRQRRGCENNIQYIGGVPTFPEYAMFSRFYPPGDYRYNPLGGIGAPGDSGGGWYNADQFLFGISSAVNGSGYYSDTVGIDITQFNSWIDSVQASIPEPGTLILLSFGAVLLGRRRA